MGDSADTPEELEQLSVLEELFKSVDEELNEPDEPEEPPANDGDEFLESEDEKLNEPDEPELDAAPELVDAEKFIPCDKIKKKTAKRIVGRIKARIKKISEKLCDTKRCEKRKARALPRLKKILAHFEKCVGKYGLFVENSVSETAEDSADTPEELEQLSVLKELFKSVDEEL